MPTGANSDHCQLTPPRARARLPCLGRSPDGEPLLAYLARDEGRTIWELWLLPIASAASGQPPGVRVLAGRRLAEGCATVPPTFSGDGRWVYAWIPDGARIRPERFATAG